MPLASLSFVFVFLPLAILLYYAMPLRFKTAMLAVLSFVFFALLSVNWAGLMLLSVTADYCLMRMMERMGRGSTGARILMRVFVFKTLALVVLNAAAMQIRTDLALPLAIFIYALSSLSYGLDYYRGDCPAQHNFANFAAHCCFFPKLYAGPLVGYSQGIVSLQAPVVSVTGIGMGLVAFVRGLAKYVVLATGISRVYAQLVALPGGSVTVLSQWLTVFACAFAVYFSLSALCDMAQGLGQVFGISLPRNFSYPFQSRTVYDFFFRFNITLSQFIHKYVYNWLGSDTGSVLGTCLNFMLTAMLMGLWFGLKINYVAWGAFLGIFIILEHFWGQRLWGKIPPFFLRIYAFFITLISFALFSGPTVGASLQMLQTMFGLTSASLYNDSALYILTSNYGLFALCLVLSTSVMARLAILLRRRYGLLSSIASALLNLVLLAVSVAFML